MAARPTDWSPLERIADPTPGDPVVVSRAANHYARVAESIKDAKIAIEAVFTADALQSQAIEALSGEALKVAERIGRAYDRYNGVADALSGYVEPLTTAQADADALLETARTLVGDADDSQTSLRYWEDERDQAIASGDATAQQQAEERITHYEGARDGAGSSLQTARYTTLPAIEEARDRAAQVAADAIELVQDSGDLNDGFWDNVDQFFEENPWVDTVMTIVGAIGAVIAVVALFVPGLNVLVLAITIGVLAVTALQVLSGNKSVTEGLISLAAAVIPLGIGKILGPALRSVGTNVASTAVTSVMRSAAGSGISGVTRPVATNIVSSVTNGVRGTVGTDFRILAEISALAKMPLLSGSVSPAINAAAGGAGFLFSGLVANEIVFPVAEQVVGGSDLGDGWVVELQDNNW